VPAPTVSPPESAAEFQPPHNTVTHRPVAYRRGVNPRAVPVLQEWKDWVTAILDVATPGVRLWGTKKQEKRSNILSDFTSTTVGTRPRSDRLRATWLVTRLRRSTRINELMLAGGFVKSAESVNK
jgi:hypothetical protein